MKTIRLTSVLLACLLAGSAFAQDTKAPLNLKLPPQSDMPPSSLPASSATAAKPAGSSTTSKSASSAPGAYYGDTSGRMGNIDERTARTQRCDDSTYNQPQVHGSVGMGVMAGSRMSGNYQTGAMSVTKNIGDCDDPKGSVNFSIGVGQSHFNGRRW